VAEADVVGSAAVADGDVEVAVWPEGDRAAIVVELRMIDLQDDALRRGVRVELLAAARAVLGDRGGVVVAGRHAGARRRGVEDEEAAVVDEVGVEREPQQAPLVISWH
jgi:hypothetical protein